jgi:predicted metal-dependent enzyme (double-stranded beta helix superfamily)
MFDIDTFVADCQRAADDSDPRGAIRELLQQTMASCDDVAAALAKDEGGLNIIHSAPDLTVLNVIWAPHMTLYPHEHRMWAAIGIYGGAEENRLYKRGTERIQPAGERVLDAGDVLGLGRDAIHAVHNPRQVFTGAIHVYGGDFVNEPRSQWDPDTLLEEPFDMAEVNRQFAAANEQWRRELGQDLDEHAD